MYDSSMMDFSLQEMKSQVIQGQLEIFGINSLEDIDRI